MTDFERFAKALALTESEDNEVAWGDAKERKPIGLPKHDPAALYQNEAQFMAVGRWQIHPSWLAEYFPLDVGVRWSWDDLFRAALERYFRTRTSDSYSPTKMAMEFHLGRAAFIRGDRDETYELRFEDWYAKLAEPETA